MNKLILIPILLGIAAVISASLISVYDEPVEPQSKPIYDTGFTYYDIETIQTILAEQNIIMSTPVAITDHTIKEYCAFYDDENILKSVQYCTTTALLDSDGEPFGNINMGGTIDGPVMALAILDTPDIFTSENGVSFVFQTMIETLVCDCWEQKQPGGFEFVGEWIDTAKMKYTQSSNTAPLKSKIDGLNGMNLILEITSKDGAYLWTLIILK